MLRFDNDFGVGIFTVRFPRISFDELLITLVSGKAEWSFGEIVAK